MRHVRCIPNGTKVPRTGHIDMRTSGWWAGGLRVVPAGRHAIAASRRDVMVPSASFASRRSTSTWLSKLKSPRTRRQKRQVVAFGQHGMSAVSEGTNARHQAQAALKKTACGCCGRVQMGWYDRKVRRVRDLSCGDTRIFLELEWAAGGPRSALHQGSEIHVSVAQGEPDARRLCEHDLRLRPNADVDVPGSRHLGSKIILDVQPSATT
jgi:hypothetical protein